MPDKRPPIFQVKDDVVELKKTITQIKQDSQYIKDYIKKQQETQERGWFY